MYTRGRTVGLAVLGGVLWACGGVQLHRLYAGPELPSSATAVIEASDVVSFQLADSSETKELLTREDCCGKVRLTVLPGRYRATVRAWKEVEAMRCVTTPSPDGRMIIERCTPLEGKFRPECTVTFTVEAGEGYRVQQGFGALPRGPGEEFFLWVYKGAKPESSMREELVGFCQTVGIPDSTSTLSPVSALRSLHVPADRRP